MNEEVDLAELVRAELARQQPFQLMQVESVRDDGLVNLVWGEQVIEGIPCNQSYLNREDGDTVLVLRHGPGWRVIDKIGGPAKIDVPSGVDLEFGPNQPAGYVQATGVWVKPGGIYLTTGVGPAPGPEDPVTSSTPKPVTLDPSARQGYRRGGKDNSHIAQGAWPGAYDYPWTSIFTFGNRIADACAGKTVDKIEVRIARTSKYHGVSGKVTPRLAMHGHTSPPSGDPSLGRYWTGPGLGMGQSKWITLPAEQRDRLASGADKGIGMYAPASRELYMICTDGCGEVRITFK